MSTLPTAAATVTDTLAAYVLRHADDNLILSQRLSEWVSRAPELEEDIALANITLDHLGVATHLLAYAARVAADGRTADDLAFSRTEREFMNVVLVEQPNGDFARTMARQMLIDAYQLRLWDALSGSTDDTLSGIAARALKESRYHYRHSSGWVIRLGDGTDESHHRMQRGIDELWRYTGELFEMDDLDREMVDRGIGVDLAGLRASWRRDVEGVLMEATLDVPADITQRGGGRRGFHTEYLGHLLSEMQWLQRTYPGLEW